MFNFGNEEKLKERYLGVMQGNALKKVKGDIFTLSIRKSEAADAPDARAVPEEYWTIKEPTVNKLAVKAALKEGKEVPGARLVQRESLQIR